MLKKIIIVILSIMMLTACNSSDEVQHDRTVKPQPMSYYRVVKDDAGNVICVETHDKLNFYKCSAADYRWMDKHGIEH